MSEAREQHLDELREIVAEVLEVEPEEITETGSFVEEHEADSLRAIEILARIEKKYKIDIPQAELPNMGHLKAVYDVVAQQAGWQD
ncbi:acyl carrier protein [Streptomyces scopuliridis]|uniref:Polyketide-8 synthase acyl carrier protein n=1 Tax=Streptomyces scopuliridis RB72 TaxID=1440053 RepID=A0A2T7T1U4_9ACTN|nr:acyl carrier protein [Streptomyces scopuliridis]PVE08991.1 polyketide-8 synthase acyl carrier protein [Streptomyces scopuliridis RB72]PVE08998.1 polyketide-8 synthase acyl carrier protein [Streptomyces scopuliridis RB72]WSB37604.1 acyl carrier protein [Streptomyces scopuliridis]WSB37611.1 acyl carrier protein [Streptomyces scopuliridis]